MLRIKIVEFGSACLLVFLFWWWRVFCVVVADLHPSFINYVTCAVL